ncbi:MAG: LysM peptidoglycan-binding domain-containing protein [Alphaproteobacteria bacterium]|nr:LysM peptidoglycan-binding domain-containing protein [Alphaproteobacteria bacterium]
MKKLDFFHKTRYDKNMYRLKYFFVLFFLFLSGCSSILLSPSYHSDGTYLYVHKGDTLYALARKNDISLRDLIEENNLKAPYNLYIGQKLRIPQAQTHTVQKGDTLYSISRKYDMNISALSRMNNLSEPYTLSVGQILKVNNTTQPVNNINSGKKKTITQNKVQTKQKKVIQQKKRTVSITKTANVPRSQSKKRFMWPVKGKIISSFGSSQKSMQNDGINIAAKKGTPVVAADAGTIGYAGNQLKGYGNLILIRHSNGWMTAYAHNDKIYVKKDQKVKKGQKIATIGKTGNVTTPQLHFEIRYKTKVVNPKTYLQ